MDVSSEMIHSLLPLFMVTVLGASALTVGLMLLWDRFGASLYVLCGRGILWRDASWFVGAGGAIAPKMKR